MPDHINNFSHLNKDNSIIHNRTIPSNLPGQIVSNVIFSQKLRRTDTKCPEKETKKQARILEFALMDIIDDVIIIAGMMFVLIQNL